VWLSWDEAKALNHAGAKAVVHEEYFDSGADPVHSGDTTRGEDVSSDRGQPPAEAMPR